MSRLAKPALALAALLLSAVVLALALELVLRLVWDDFYLSKARGNIEFHPTRGWANKPSISVEYGKPEFKITVTHNSLGFRGPELPAERPADRIRVLALGDSMTYGLGVENDETFSVWLERLDPHLEVINAGVNGYSSAEELLLLQEVGLALKPEIVLLGYLWNDIEAPRATHARFAVRDGVLERLPVPESAYDELRRKRVRHSWLGRSYAYRFVSDRLKIARYMLEELLGVPSDEGRGMTDDEREQAWELVFALLRETARVSEESGARFVLVAIPDEIQVQPDVDVVGVDPGLFTVQERLARLAEESGMALIDLLPGLRAAYARDGRSLYYRYDRHLNALGHREVARLILDGLARYGMLAPERASQAAASRSAR